MKIFVLLSIFYSMQTQKIHVLNIKNNEAIDSAQIIVFSDGKLIKNGFTNASGEYEINIPYDSIQIHSYGFEDKTIINNNYKENKIYLTEKTYLLDEITLNSKNKNIIIGQHIKKSSEQTIVNLDEKFALFFKNPNEKNYKVKSIFLNFKKAPNDTELELNFYEKKIIERDYKNQETKLTTKLSEIIPDTKKNIGKLNFKVNKNLNKHIIEIYLDSIDINMPSDGLFVSIKTKKVYNEKEIIKITSYEHLPVLFNHKTNENNFCVKMQNTDDYWQNINLIGRHHENTDKYHPLIPMKFYEPSISLKISE